eukprot:COSAG01_NODE_4993_length_4560_cov_31.921991_4_plen_43_part_00
MGELNELGRLLGFTFSELELVETMATVDQVSERSSCLLILDG